jgi:glycosyltransferase involved in cell wall biosynthesis
MDNADFEVIYVDSKSTDDSIERAKKFDLQIFKITGECNAAIARNIGAKEAIGDILFFIDGDMELESSFLSHVYSNKYELENNCLTGHLDDYFYTTEGEFLESKSRTYKKKLPKTKELIQMNGGVFLISKKNWKRIDGMKTKYRRSQDLDLFLRLSKIGIHIIRLPHLIVKHHTVDYRNEDRMWKDVMKGNIFYDSLIFRDHLLSLSSIKRVLRSKYTSLLLMTSFIILVTKIEYFYYFMIIYFGALILRVSINTINTATVNKKLIYYLKRFAYQITVDILFWIGVITFFPRIKTENYKSL